MSTPAIPAPGGFRIVSGIRRLVHMVEVDHGTVVCDYDESGCSEFYPVLRFTVLDEGRHTVVSLAVTEAFRAAGAIGDVAVSTVVSCGGHTDVPVISGTADDVAAVIAAIPYFYADERDAEIRRAFRSVYRWLRRTASTQSERAAVASGPAATTTPTS